MDAYDFAKPLHKDSEGKAYCFGTDKKNCSQSLRSMAACIDSGDIAIQQVIVSSKANFDDFTTTTIVLKLVERAQIEKRKIEQVENVLDRKSNIKKLYVSDVACPVAVAEIK